MAYNTGDILVTGTWPVPIFDHYAIVFYDNNIGYVAHNSIRKGVVIFTPLIEFLEKNKIRRVISTNETLTDEHIINKANEVNEQGKRYNFFGYNCESFVMDVCACRWGTDQRKEFIFYLVALSILSLVVYKLLKRV